MVFCHLTSRDILKSTLISPKANQIISNSVHLLKNFRFKIGGYRPNLGSRKYSKIDYCDLKHRFPDPPTLLTQLSLNNCWMDADLLQRVFSEMSNTLELLIISSCHFQLAYDWDKCENRKLRYVQMMKLKTLILMDLNANSGFITLSIIKTSTLAEFGLIRLHELGSVKEWVAKLFVGTVKCNPKIKILHTPPVVTEMFISEALKHPEIEHRFEDLSFALEYGQGSFCDLIMDFLATQKDTLRSCRFEDCDLTENHFIKLLSFNLVQLEFHICWLETMTDTAIKNSTIENLTFIGKDGLTHETVKSIAKCCTSLSTCVAYNMTPPDMLFYLTTSSWQTFDLKEMRPKSISYELRSLRHAGIAYAVNFTIRHHVDRRYHIYHSRLMNKSIKEHPYSVIEFVHTLLHL